MRTDTERLDFFEQNSSEFRYISTPSMDGKYPAWSVWTQKRGRTADTISKTLRGAIDMAMDERMQQ